MSRNFDVIFDVETKTSRGDSMVMNPAGMYVSVVCAYRSDLDKIETFWEEDLRALEELFQGADRIIGYNSWGFDEPVLHKYFSVYFTSLRCIDMLEAIRKSIGTRIKLDVIAQATLGVGKSGNGLDAVKYWNSGNLEELEKYCKQDVIVTKDIFYKGLENGKIAYIDGLDKVVEFDVSWSDGERLPEGTNSPQTSLF